MPNKNRKGKIYSKESSLEDSPSFSAKRAAQRAAAAATSNNDENDDIIDSSTSTATTSVHQSPLVENAPVTEPPLPSAVPKSAWTPQAEQTSEVQCNVINPSHTVAQERNPSTVPKSTANPCSQGVYRTDRATSAYTMRRESISTVTTTDDTISSRQPRSQSVTSTRGRGRHLLLSAVPDTANLTPMLRPDAGGSKGRPVSIYTNHFPVRLDYNATVNQYDVEIMLIDRDGKPRSARKDERWKAMQLIARGKKDFPTVW